MQVLKNKLETACFQVQAETLCQLGMRRCLSLHLLSTEPLFHGREGGLLKTPRVQDDSEGHREGEKNSDSEAYTFCDIGS